MTRYAQIEFGIVQFTTEQDTDPDGTSGGWVECPTHVGDGFGYDGFTFTAPGSEIPHRIVTHLEFRRLFTTVEQELCDELEVTFEANPALSAAQKRSLRTGYKNFYAASEVNLDDPDIPPMLGMYVALGILDAQRPAEILS